MASRKKSKASQRRAIDRVQEITRTQHAMASRRQVNSQWRVKGESKGEQVPESTIFHTPSTRNGEWKVSNSPWRMQLLTSQVRAGKTPQS